MEEPTITRDSQPEHRHLESTHPFTQWLRTYLLWAHILGIEPQVFTFSSDKESSVQDSLRWQKDNLWVSNDLLARMSPRLLAILAVRDYLEQALWRRYLVLFVLLGVLLAMAALAVSAYVRRLLGATPLWGLVHLFIVPVVLEVPAYLRDLACRQADDEAFERLGNPHLFLQAVQIALEESYRCGETHKQLQRMLKRLNRLRARLGEPPLTSQEVKRRVGKPEQQQEESMSAANTVAEEE